MGDIIGWGIIGTGKIAKAFATDLGLLPDAELVAVGSRKAESANHFGEQGGICSAQYLPHDFLVPRHQIQNFAKQPVDQPNTRDEEVDDELRAIFVN